MKTFYIIAGLVVVFILIAQIMVYASSKNTLAYPYKVEQKINEKFEIRVYESCTFAKVELSQEDYNEIANKGFRILAGYIFGGNSENKKISMTSPVLMEYHNVRTMEFMMPTNFSVNDLPVPNNSNIDLYVKPEWKAAVLTFGGFANEEKIQAKIEELKQLLAEQNITHKGNFKFMGYNPPYQLVGRKNEVVVELD
jgi:hypothetical protein